VIRWVWAPLGKRPIARLKRGCEWTYVYGFVRPESGEVYWLVLPTANVELFSMALREFAKEVGAGEERRILLVVDTRPGGTLEARSRSLRSLKVYTSSSFPRAPRSYSQRRGCGR